MPFGKHRGKDLADVPSDYLDWLLTRAENVAEWLRDAVYEELLVRDLDNTEENGATERGAAVLPLETLRSQLKAWYREMTMKYHPDRRSGQDDGMRAIIAGYERLTEMLGLPR